MSNIIYCHAEEDPIRVGAHGAFLCRSGPLHARQPAIPMGADRLSTRSTALEALSLGEFMFLPDPRNYRSAVVSAEQVFLNLLRSRKVLEAARGLSGYNLKDTGKMIQ